jgi:hypothetical protein
VSPAPTRFRGRCAPGVRRRLLAAATDRVASVSGCVTISGSGPAIAGGSLAIGASAEVAFGLGVVGEPVADGRLHVSLRRGVIALVCPLASLLGHGRESTAPIA